MTVSPREKAMAAVALLVLLYGAVGLTLRGRLDSLSALREAHREQLELLSSREELIAQRGAWETQYAALQDLMPVFEQGRRVDTYWLGIMDRLAASNNLAIVRRQIGAERQVGDVYEMPIDCKDWEGTLEALVGFLYDLQAEGAMLDMRQMYVRPTPRRPELLRGSFTLHCAYLRDQTATNAAAGEGQP